MNLLMQPSPLPCRSNSEGVYLGPARVHAVGRRRVLLAFPDQQAWATLALSQTYEPAVGDVVLVITQDDRWYVIGILEGRGTTSITAAGNLELRAPHGEIRLTSGRGVTLKSKRVKIGAEVLEIAAGAVSERFRTARRRVGETYEIVARGIKAVAAETLRLKGRRITQRAEEEVKIDGQQVRLG